MDSSLENLIENWQKDKFQRLHQNFEENKLERVKQKGMYPYANVKLFKNLIKKNYPIKNYNSLKDKHVSNEDYEHAKKCRMYSK